MPIGAKMGVWVIAIRDPGRTMLRPHNRSAEYTTDSKLPDRPRPYLLTPLAAPRPRWLSLADLGYLTYATLKAANSWIKLTNA